MSHTIRLSAAGDSTVPCGTPAVYLFVMKDLSLYYVHLCLPVRSVSLFE